MKKIILTPGQLKKILKAIDELKTYYFLHIEDGATKEEEKFAEEVENLQELLNKKL